MANLKHGAWNAIVSAIADPALHKLAERFTSSISEDSWFRSEFAERLLAGLKGLAEGYKVPGVAGLVVEKATDFFDFASGDLYGKGGKGSGSATSAAHGWLNRFVKNMEKSLREAPKDKLAEIQARLQQEFTIVKEFVRMVEEAEKESAPEKKPPGKPIEIGKAFHGFVEEAKKRARRHGYKDRRK